MRNCINIKGHSQTIPYLIEYVKNAADSNGHNIIEGNDVVYYLNQDVVRLISPDIQYYRQQNEWYNIDSLSGELTDFIPKDVKTTNIKVYIPAHSVSTYLKKIKYAVSINTWIQGTKIDLGTFMFKPSDTYAIPTGPIKKGNNEYFECIDFNIIDPFYLIYSSDWDSFRKNICKEIVNTNDTGTELYVSLYVVNETEENADSYIGYNGLIGGYTNFNISNSDDYLSLNLDIQQKDSGPYFIFTIKLNEVYYSLIEYLKETYHLIQGSNGQGTYDYDTIRIDLAIKGKDVIIPDVISINYTENNKTIRNSGNITLKLSWQDWLDSLNNQQPPQKHGIKDFFSTWENFEEGLSAVASLTVYDSHVDDNDIISILSNEVLITQDVFSIFTNGGCKKIIDLNDMEIQTYTVVNKIENNIVQIERPNESKSNIVQPVFFRAKDTETLTLHPMVTENISINLDDYKSKVERFILQIGDCRFDQIGANSYGILFKITANVLPKIATSGIYYILDQNYELVTTGKYSTIL